MTPSEESGCQKTRFALLVGGLLLFATAVAVVYGLVHNQDKFPLRWSGSVLAEYTAILTVGAVVLLAVILWRRNLFLSVSAVAMGGVAVAGVGVAPLAIATLIMASAYALGGMLLRAPATQLEDHLFRFEAGLACLILVLFAAYHFPINTQTSHAALYLLPLLVGRKRLCEAKSALLVYSRMTWNWPDRLVAGMIVLVLCLYLFLAITPEMGADSLTNYVPMGRYLAKTAVWHFDVNIFSFANQPLGIVWLWMSAQMLGDVAAAKLVNFGFFVLTLLHISLLARRLSGNVAAALAPLFLALLPVSVWEGIQLYYDTATSMFILGAYGAFLRRRTDLPQHFLLSAGLAGVAVSCKAISAGGVLPLVIAGLFSKRKKSEILLAAGLFLLLAVPPYLQAYIETGNPVFPFMNGVFRSLLMQPENFVHPYLGHVSIDLLYRLTFDSSLFTEGLPGAAGFHLLALWPAATAVVLIVGGKEGRHLAVFAVAAFMIVSSQFQYLRYYQCIMPLLCVICAIGTAWLLQNGPRVWRLTTGLVALTVLSLDIWVLPTTYTRVESLHPLSLLTQEGRERFVKSFWAADLLAKHIDAEWGNGSNVLFLNVEGSGALRQGGFNVLAYTHTQVWDPMIMAKSAEGVRRIVMNLGLTHFIYRDGEMFNGSVIRSFLERHTVLVMRIGNVYLARVADQDLYPSELLNHDEGNPFAGWSITGQVELANGRKEILIHPNGVVSTRVPVIPNRPYLLTVAGKCAGPDKGHNRIQVDWYDGQGRFIDWDYSVQSCSDDERLESLRLTSPSEASRATISLAAQSGSGWIEGGASFKGVSAEERDMLLPEPIVGWGPFDIAAGRVFNPQPSGQAAIWVRMPGLKEDAVLTWNGIALPTTLHLSEMLATAIVPSALYAQPGLAEIVVAYPDGKRSKPVILEVVMPRNKGNISFPRT